MQSDGYPYPPVRPGGPWTGRGPSQEGSLPPEPSGQAPPREDLQSCAPSSAQRAAGWTDAWPRQSSEPPISAFLYGSSRPLVNLVLFALAEEVSPSFHWLDIRSPGESPAPFDPARLGWIDERRSWTLSPREALEPDNAQANAALFELVRGDEPPAMLARLSDFFRLPERMKEILAEIPSGRRPGVLAVANVQRAMHALPESALSPIVDALAWAGFSLLVGYVGPPPPIRARFTHALRIDGEGPSRWQDAQVVLEGNTPLRDLRPRTPTGLTELPFVSQVLQRALGDV